MTPQVRGMPGARQKHRGSSQAASRVAGLMERDHPRLTAHLRSGLPRRLLGRSFNRLQLPRRAEQCGTEGLDSQQFLGAVERFQ